jgi:hypothetical protein
LTSITKHISNTIIIPFNKVKEEEEEDSEAADIIETI